MRGGAVFAGTPSNSSIGLAGVPCCTSSAERADDVSALSGLVLTGGGPVGLVAIRLGGDAAVGFSAGGAAAALVPAADAGSSTSTMLWHFGHVNIWPIAARSRTSSLA